MTRAELDSDEYDDKGGLLSGQRGFQYTGGGIFAETNTHDV